MADGMGGHAGGDIASATAVKRIRELDADPALGPADLEETIQAAQRNIIDRVSTEPVLSGMGTTVTSLLLRSEEHTSELQSRGHLVCRLLLEKKKHLHR